MGTEGGILCCRCFGNWTGEAGDEGPQFKSSKFRIAVTFLEGNGRGAVMFADEATEFTINGDSLGTAGIGTMFVVALVGSGVTVVISTAS